MAKAKEEETVADPTEEAVSSQKVEKVSDITQPFTIMVDGKVVWESSEEAVDVMGVSITPDHGAVVDIPSPIGSVGMSIVVNIRAASSTYLDKIDYEKAQAMHNPETVRTLEPPAEPPVGAEEAPVDMKV